ncbi:MAG: hypothetical protein ACKOPS_24965 [Cyanobium sp.]
MADLEQTHSDALAGAHARRIRKRAGVELPHHLHGRLVQGASARSQAG